MRDGINAMLDHVAQSYQLELSAKTYNLRFAELVIKLHQTTGQKVVLLIDEYDKPILNNLFKPSMAEIKQVIGAFYGVAKSLDKHLKFVFDSTCSHK